MTRNFGPLPEILDLETALELIPKREMTDYRHKEWQKVLTTAKSSTVVQHPSLEEVLKAQKTGEEIQVRIMTGYKLFVLGDDGKKNSDDAQEDYILGDTPGNREFAVVVQEDSYWKKLRVSEVTTKSRDGKIDPDNWGFVGYYGYVSGSGYYETWEEAEMAFICEKGVMRRVTKKDK